ncbi:MAG TPA: PQQ-dependent sugar dehydrogenase [Candidatus Limnocylindria bacterium]|nr:PQQ-dependent sugar dehydrogenase [Candidatus Limnocylindria bacterium]
MRRSLAVAVAALVACGAPATAPDRTPASTASRTPGATSQTIAPTRSPTPTPSPRLGPAVLENVQLIAAGLEVPWAIAIAPDGRIFVTERPGRVRIARLGGGGLQAEPWARVPARANPDAERGLLGIALDPDFARTAFVYLYYSYAGPGGATLNRLVRLRDANGVGVDETILVDNIPGAANHDGGRIAFGPDGKLYVATGDGEVQNRAQDRGSLGGKILRLEKDGSVPADNPFPGSPVYSLGHRNVQGIAFHPDTGVLYETEHGPSGFFPACCQDEVNRIEPGANYGWPLVTGRAGDQRFRDPILSSGATDTWAPSGAAFATRPGPLRGSFLFAGLRAQHLHRIVLTPDGRGVAFEERLLVNQYGRLRDVYEISTGEFLVLTSNRDGRGRPAADDDRMLLVTLR